MDMDIPVRLFFQKAVMGSQQWGVRFYAHQGVLVSAHISKVFAIRIGMAVAYITVRHPKLERQMQQLVEAMNYNGFGAAWWLLETEGGTDKVLSPLSLLSTSDLHILLFLLFLFSLLLIFTSSSFSSLYF